MAPEKEVDISLDKIKDIEVAPKRELPGLLNQAVILTGVVMSLFHVVVLIFRPIDPWYLRSLHIAFGAVLVFALVPGRQGASMKRIPPVDYLFMAAIIVPIIYLFVEFEGWIFRAGVTPTTADAVFAFIFVFGVLEMARRATGYALPIIALLLILYGYFGPYMPGLFQHRGYGLARMLTFLFSLDGILSIPIFASSHYIFFFILFGAFLEASGLGKFTVEFARSVAGSRRGGPAKVSIVSSALIGTTSGSSVANVMVDGVFNIPLMKASGFRPAVACAIEAMNSSGGQMVPPVMGAGAFLMAEILGLPYWQVALAAVIPAVMYYSAAYWMIDLYAAKTGLVGIPRDQLPSARRLLKDRGYLFIPFAVLIFNLMVVQLSPFRSAAWAILVLLVLGMFKAETRLGPKKIYTTLFAGARSSMEIIATCAAAGIILGVIAQTGLGMKAAIIILSYSKGYLLLALFFTMLIAIILGMGLPTTAAYVISASVLAPGLIKMGVEPIAAHLFIFYYACLSPLTPPMAVAAFAAAAIGKASFWDVGWLSVKFALAGFVVPYMFVYGPAMVLEGSWWEILLALASGLLGTFALSAAVQGYFLGNLKYTLRVALIVVALLLLKPGWLTDAAGMGALIGVYVVQARRTGAQLLAFKAG
jgi:TRAP transporter 4TM/12TM fusion protein